MLFLNCFAGGGGGGGGEGLWLLRVDRTINFAVVGRSRYSPIACLQLDCKLLLFTGIKSCGQSPIACLQLCCYC